MTTSTQVQDFEQLRLLLKGALSNRAANALKKRIAEDAEFRAEAIEYLSLMRQLKAIDPARDEVKAILANATTAPANHQGIRTLLYVMRYSSAASILVLIGFSLFFLINLPNRSRISLSEEEAPKIISISLKSPDGGLFDPEFEFRHKNYNKAAEGYFQAYQANPAEIGLLYNYAVACFKDKQWAAAQGAFQKTAAVTSFHFRDDAEFYWAISLINGKKSAEGTEILEAIAINPEHKKRAVAKKIVLNLKKN